jgi:hypothetical protein
MSNSFASVQAYKSRVDDFIKQHSQAIGTVDIEWCLTAWNFEQDMSAENQAAHEAAVGKHARLRQSFSANAEAVELLDNELFNGLGLIERRALSQIERFYRGFEPAKTVQVDKTGKELLSSRECALLRLRRDFTCAELAAGPAVGASDTFANLMLEVVRLRNQIARSSGYADYYRMMVGSDQDYEMMRSHTADLRVALNAIFERSIERKLLTGRGLQVAVVDCFSKDCKSAYSVLTRTAELLGMPQRIFEQVIAKSDLHPREHKKSLSALWCIDAPFDIRASLNFPIASEDVKPADIQIELLHEIIGHGFDVACIRPDLPSVLRKRDSFATEVVAMLMERLVYEPRWLRLVGGLDKRTIKQHSRELMASEFESTLMRVRTQIMLVQFEVEMYANPEQDLDILYQQLMREYLGRKKLNARDSAPGAWSLQNSHFLEAPCYCHNYALGTAWVLQIREALRRKFGSFASRRVGPYLAKTRSLGLLYSRNEQLTQLAGEPFDCNVIVRSLEDMLLTLG